MADYQAVLDGKKPVYAKSAQASEPHFYQGEGYQLDIIKESITLGGVRGFLYGLMLDLDAEPGKAEDLESISHVTFYTVPELKKLLGTP